MITREEIAACRWHGADGAEHVARIAEFLEEIGIAVECGPIEGETATPGIAIRDGAIRIDPEIEAWPGDLLHEAGHIAVTESENRALLGTLPTDPGMEMAAIAWSAAATMPCQVPLGVLFHEGGYRGRSAQLIAQFAGGQYVGAPMLAWFGMTAEPHRAAELGVPAYPAMQRWLR